MTVQQTFSKPTIYKTWIGENLQFLELKKRGANFDYGDGIVPFELTYSDSVITLTLDKKKGWIYLFKIVHLTEDSLVVSPLNEKSRPYTKGKDTFVFIERGKWRTKAIRFHDLFFSQTKCNDGCNSFRLFIDSSGLIYFQTLIPFKNYNGTYRGQLDKIELTELNEILTKLPLDNFPTDLGFAIGLTEKTFVFHYDNKTKISSGYCIPQTATPLEDYLLLIYEKVDWVKTNELFFDHL